MKKTFLVTLCCCALLALSFQSATNPLLGRWESISKNKQGTFRFLAIFHDNDTYDGVVNGKAFLTAKYHLQHDTILLRDEVCDARTTGLYRVIFINPDSICFKMISDSCIDRRQGTDGMAFKRLKNKK